MNTQLVQSVNAQVRSIQPTTSDSIKEKREKLSIDNASEQVTPNNSNSIQPEELLSNIKALTEDGLYSVRFEMNHGSRDLIINLVDNESGEVIRQIPPEEIIKLHEYMEDLRGNIVSIES
jgi:flagellar protein FlaG